MCATCIVTGVAYAAVPMSVYRFAVLRRMRKPTPPTGAKADPAPAEDAAEAAEEESAPAAT